MDIKKRKSAKEHEQKAFVPFFCLVKKERGDVYDRRRKCIDCN